jgi:hypothetical protein
MYLKGNNISVRVGNSQMNPTDVAQNVLNGLEFAGTITSEISLFVLKISSIYMLLYSTENERRMAKYPKYLFKNVDLSFSPNLCQCWCGGH